MRFLLAALLAVGLGSAAQAASLDGIAVEVENGSEPILCAEKDNVSLTFSSPRVTRFHVEAAHPVYIGGVREDRYAPDWAACEDIPAAACAVRPPRDRCLHAHEE